MKTKLILVVLILTLSGCTTFSDLEDSLRRLKGRKISDALIIFGNPNQVVTTSVIEDVYIWRISQTSSFNMPTTRTGNIYDQYNNRYTYSYQGSQPTYIHSECTIYLNVFSVTGEITSWRYGGNIYGCGHYGSLLKRHGY